MPKSRPHAQKGTAQVRVVADTNTIISGLMWSGVPRQILNAARMGRIQLFTSAALLAELDDVLRREKFARQLARVGTQPRRLLSQFAALALVVHVPPIAPTVLADPDDDAVVACALAAEAEIIVSGDSHLLQLQNYRDVAIISAKELLERLSV